MEAIIAIVPRNKQSRVIVCVCACVCVCVFESTHTAVGPVDVEEGEREKSLVALLGEQLLLKLDKISFKVDHFWCAAISPAQQTKQSFMASFHFCRNEKSRCSLNDNI